ncbi:hypothetical protein FRC11_013989 [Ceratobasidium sp. 423]|nr:hypothetical protein FRC11_013989 [Ceratobasidium sp. 423]
MTHSAHDLINSLIKNAQDNTNAQNTAGPTGNEGRVGLYNYPPNDPRSHEHVSGRHRSHSMEWHIHYQAELDHDKQKRHKSIDTRAKNASLRQAQVKVPAARACPSHDEQEESNHIDLGEVCPAAQHGRSCTIHALSHSPSLGSTNCELEQSTQVPGESQYTYKYKTLDHEGLVNCAQEEFGLDVHGCDTQTIIDRIQLATAEQASQIVMLPSMPFQVGGGWSQQVVGSSQPSGPPKRRLQQAADLSEGSSKWQCTEATVDDDTAMELETDDEPIANQASARSADNDLQSLQNVTQAPPPLREPTSTTVLDAQPSDPSSHSLGGSVTHSCPRSLAHYGVSLSPSDNQSSEQAPPPLGGEPPSKRTKCPQVLAPLCGPVHTHLHAKLLTRHITECLRDNSQALSRANNQIDEVQSDLDEVPETKFGSSTNTPHPTTHQPSSNSHTYGGHCSHLPSEPGTTAARSTDTANAADALGELSLLNLPTLSQLIQREREWTVAAKSREGMSETVPRSRPMFATTSQPPASRLQPRPPPQGSAAAVQRVGGTSHWLDPISATHKDMLTFNQAVARGEATSFIESVTRQSERTAWCTPPESHQLAELLDDDEEMLAQAKAYSKGKWPDVSGLAQQVLIMAKIHLFAYALIEGVYQTCATYLRWAAIVHWATWEMDLPDHPYEKPSDEILEITITPHSGEYENPEIAHCIALAMFNSPNSVRVLYPDYFWDMPLTAIAFALAIISRFCFIDSFEELINLFQWRFCIEEWANGWWQNGDLGMASMHKKYKSQLAGLKELRTVAPRCMHCLQNQWRDYVVEYLGASFEPENNALSVHRSQMRPDTPEPDAISVEEMDACLLKTGHQNSIRLHMEELVAKELVQPMSTNEGDSEGSQAPSSRSPSPRPAECNQHRVLTTHAKGKGHAN